MEDLIDLEDKIDDCIHELRVVMRILTYEDNENQTNDNCGLILILQDIEDKLKNINEKLNIKNGGENEHIPKRENMVL